MCHRVAALATCLEDACLPELLGTNGKCCLVACCDSISLNCCGAWFSLSIDIERVEAVELMRSSGRGKRLREKGCAAVKVEA